MTWTVHDLPDDAISVSVRFLSPEPERDAQGDSDGDDDSREEDASGDSEDGVQHE